MTKTFVEIADDFADLDGWGEHDAPGLAALSAIGSALDSGDRSPSMFSQWGLMYRALVKAREGSVTPTEVDPLAALLKR